MKIVCIGDSLTYGYMVKRSEVWTHLIQNKYDIKVLNRGINGDTTGGMLSRFYHDVVAHKPSHVMIMGGSNDFIMEVPKSIVHANISAMVYQSYDKRIQPILGVPMGIEPNMAKEYWPGRTDFVKVNERVGEYRKWILEFGKLHNILVIDFYRELEEKLKGKDPREYYMDGLHMNTKGQEMMANMTHLDKII